MTKKNAKKERRVVGERPTARAMVDLEEEGRRREGGKQEERKIQRFFPPSSITTLTTLGKPRLFGIW